jgi:hypothetical protein
VMMWVCGFWVDCGDLSETVYFGRNEMEILVNPIEHNAMDVTAQVGSVLPR